jgi:phospholipid/cholesterol/gamma-HCH transport system substrate-binding protein
VNTVPSTPGLKRGRTEIWVGVFVLGGLLAILVLLFTLTNPALFRGRYEVTLIVDDASGLRRGDAVQMRGVGVGRVRSFAIIPRGVAIGLELEKDLTIPADSRAVLRSSSLLGEMYVDIMPGKSPEPLASDGTLHGSTAGNPIGQAGQLANQATGTLDRLQMLLSPEVIENLKQTTAELPHLLEQLSALAGEARALTDSVERTVGGVRRVTTGPELMSTVDNLDNLSQRLNALADTLDASTTSAAAILARVSRGEGSLGRLTRDDALYVNTTKAMNGISQAAAAFQHLAEDIQKNPKKYVKVSVF